MAISAFGYREFQQSASHNEAPRSNARGLALIGLAGQSPAFVAHEAQLSSSHIRVVRATSPTKVGEKGQNFGGFPPNPLLFLLSKILDIDIVSCQPARLLYSFTTRNLPGSKQPDRAKHQNKIRALDEMAPLPRRAVGEKAPLPAKVRRKKSTVLMPRGPGKKRGPNFPFFFP